MITASFLSEWVKLKRKSLLLSAFLGLAAAASLFAVLIFSNAPAHGSGGGLPSLQQLARPNGLVFGLTRATFLLGVVAFGTAAAGPASPSSPDGAATASADTGEREPSRPAYVCRFAPTPSGALHLGSLYTAVGSYLDARAQGGRWLVRMEDLDRAREVRGAADGILRTLERFGLEWDGEVRVQSSRTRTYAGALDALRRRHLDRQLVGGKRPIVPVFLESAPGGAGRDVHPLG